MKKVLMTLMIVSAGLFFNACGACANDGKQGKEEKSMKTIELNKESFNQKVADISVTDEWKYLGDKPAIIDFYATWCGPCKAIAPILEELAEEYKDDIVIYKVDVDKEPEIAGAFGIRSMPSLLFIPLNDKPQMAVGAMPKADFEKAIKDVLLNK